MTRLSPDLMARSSVRVLTAWPRRRLPQRQLVRVSGVSRSSLAFPRAAAHRRPPVQTTARLTPRRLTTRPRSLKLQ